MIISGYVRNGDQICQFPVIFRTGSRTSRVSQAGYAAQCQQIQNAPILLRALATTPSTMPGATPPPVSSHSSRSSLHTAADILPTMTIGIQANWKIQGLPPDSRSRHSFQHRVRRRDDILSRLPGQTSRPATPPRSFKENHCCSR